MVFKMLKEKLFFYKAQRTDNGEWVEGRVRHPQSVTDGVEETTYFDEYTGNKYKNSEWSSCTVITSTITPLTII